jgi:WD40 repeat protein
MYSVRQEKYILRPFEIARGDTMIVNCIKFLSKSELMTSCNDCSVKIWDLNTMVAKFHASFKDPINIASVSPDGNLLGVFGDCVQAEVLDIRSNQLVAQLFGHDDFGFSLAWHPDGQLLATGNQDQTCKVWDLRYTRGKVRPYCLQTIDCLIGAASHIKFIGSDKMAFSETIDHIQVFDCATFTQHQDIDLFGRITGFDTHDAESSLILGVSGDLSCLMEYKLAGKDDDLNALLL